MAQKLFTYSFKTDSPFKAGYEVEAADEQEAWLTLNEMVRDHAENELIAEITEVKDEGAVRTPIDWSKVPAKNRPF